MLIYLARFIFSKTTLLFPSFHFNHILTKIPFTSLGVRPRETLLFLKKEIKVIFENRFNQKSLCTIFNRTAYNFDQQELFICSEVFKMFINQKQPSRGVLKKICSEIMQQIYGCFATLLKSHFGTGALPQICCIFSEHLFLRTPLDGCFWLIHTRLLQNRLHIFNFVSLLFLNDQLLFRYAFTFCSQLVWTSSQSKNIILLKKKKSEFSIQRFAFQMRCSFFFI